MTTEQTDTEKDQGFRAGDLLSNKAWIVVACLLLLAVVLRLWGFTRYWLNPDEGIYYSMVTWNSWGDFITEYQENAHPPLYYLLLRGIGSLTTGFDGLRGVAFVGGCLWPLGVFLLTRECGRRSPVATLAGMIAMLIMVVSPTAIVMSQIMRPYTMLNTALVFGLWQLVCYLQRHRRRHLTWSGLCFIVAALTHYSSFLVFAAVGLVILGLLVLRQIQLRQIGWLAALYLPLIVTVVVLYVVHIGPSMEGSSMQTLAVTGWLADYMSGDLAFVWRNTIGTFAMMTVPGFGAAMFLVFCAGMVMAVRRRQWLIVLFPVAALLVAVPLSVMQKYPFGCSRHSLYLLNTLLLPVAFAPAFGLLQSRVSAIVTALSLLVLLVVQSLVPALLVSETARQKVVDEQMLRRSQVENLLPGLQRMAAESGVILMSEQPYFSLLPLYRQERQDAHVTDDGMIRRFRWGAREVVVWDVWEFRMLDEHLGQKEHLITALERIDKVMPDLRLSQDRQACFIFAGWIEETPFGLDQATVNGKRLVGRHLIDEDRRLVVMEFDLAVFLAAVRTGTRRKR